MSMTDNLDQMTTNDNENEATEKFENQIIQNSFQMFGDGIKTSMDPNPQVPMKSKRRSQLQKMSKKSPQLQKMSKKNKSALICSICRKKFVSRTSLKNHTNTVHRQERFRCDATGCAKSFGRKDYLQKHLAKVHRKEIDWQEEIECSICQERFPDRSSMLKHSSQDHGTRVWPCEICPKIFSKKSSFEGHKQKIHSKVKDLACHLCDQKFSLSVSLFNHQVTTILKPKM
jgi:hypothetical protein